MKLWSLGWPLLSDVLQGLQFTEIFLGNFPWIFFLSTFLFPSLQPQCHVCASFRRTGRRILHLTAAVLALDAWTDKS